MERINKVLARSTDFSRREIEKFIIEGRIKVDGKLLTTQGIKVSPSNKISIDETCLLYTSPSPRDRTRSRMPSSA